MLVCGQGWGGGQNQKLFCWNLALTGDVDGTGQWNGKYHRVTFRENREQCLHPL